MNAKYKVSISYGSKVIAKVKVDNRQTDRQTDKQDKNNMPPIIRSGGIKIVWTGKWFLDSLFDPRSYLQGQGHSAHILEIDLLVPCSDSFPMNPDQKTLIALIYTAFNLNNYLFTHLELTWNFCMVQRGKYNSIVNIWHWPSLGLQHNITIM